jgi:hypothetical protein
MAEPYRSDCRQLEQEEKSWALEGIGRVMAGEARTYWLGLA